jgi:putative transposase
MRWSDRWGRVGAAGDNAAMESFVSMLQKNVLNRRCSDTCTNYGSRSSRGSNGPHHRRRRQSGSESLTPIEFEAIMTTPPASQAA